MAASPFPARIGRYELLVPIASGGMATVYLARLATSAGFDRMVALKRIHPHLREDSTFVLDFLDEARLAGKIHHPNVVAVLDAEDDPEGPYLVMDYVEGDSLASLERALRTADARCDDGIALRILDDALAGLHAAHELAGDDGANLGVVHRDFTPQNILVGTDGHTRLTDFGIAKAAAHGGRTRTGHIKGKVSYMAPEQLRGERLDRRADVWAAGAVAWELFGNRKCFAEEEELATAMKVVEGAVPTLRSVRPDLPAALDEAIASALERDPAERCPSAAELRRRIARASAELGSPASAADVGAWVRRLAGEKLRLRAKEVERVKSDRAAKEEPRATAEAATETKTSGAHAGTSTTEPGSRLRPAMIVAGLGAVATVVLVTRGFSSRTNESPPPPPPSTTVVSADPPKPPPSGETVAISANAPMRELHVGERAIALPRPVAAVAIEVTAAERAAHAPVLAVASDGRTAEATLEEGTSTLGLTFASDAPSASQARHRKPRPTPTPSAPSAKSTTTTTGESLLPSPYPGQGR